MRLSLFSYIDTRLNCAILASTLFGGTFICIPFASADVRGNWPVVTEVNMKYLGSETVSVSWRWERTGVVITDAEADTLINPLIDGYFGGFYYKEGGKIGTVSLKDHAPGFSITDKSVTWRDILRNSETVASGNATIVISKKRGEPSNDSCIGFSLFSGNVKKDDLIEGQKHNLPGGMNDISQCVQIPAAFEWCKMREKADQFDFKVIRIDQAVGRYRNIDLKIDCTDDATFLLRLEGGGESIPLNNGMNVRLTLTADNEPLSTPIEGLKGLNLISLNATLSGVPVRDGPFQGKGVIFIEYL